MESSITRRQLLIDGGKVAVAGSLLSSLLVACGGETGGSGAPTTQQLQYWVLGYQPKGSNQTGKLTDAAIAAYLKGHTNVKVAITGYTGDQAGFTKVTQAVTGGQVDVFRLPSDILPLLAKQGKMAPIDDFLTAEDKSDIYPHLLDAVKFNGKHYSWPLWVPPVGMYINLDIFKEKGVEPPKDNWTYDEFVDIARKLTFTRSNGQKVYGFTALIDPGVVNAWPIILGEGASPLSPDNTKYTFNSPEGIRGLQKLVDLALKYKVTPPDFGTQALTDIQNGFSQQKNYAMYPEPSGASAGYKASGLNFDVKPMPIGSTGKPVTAGGIGLISVANIGDQEKLKVAMDLARYLTGSQVGKDVQGYYLAPGSRKSVQVSDPIDKFSPFVSYCYITPIIAQWPQIRTILHKQIQDAILGRISPEKALNDPAQEINSILASGQ
ncbi:MAG: extracellular solute-binding protein [Ktedonobacteraceae bacterium]|nr:extracellular solute-binding protein [Ktedonobacteraceae bacterium]